MDPLTRKKVRESIPRFFKNQGTAGLKIEANRSVKNKTNKDSNF